MSSEHDHGYFCGVIYATKANCFPFVSEIEPLAHDMFTSGLYSVLMTEEILLILYSFFPLKHRTHKRSGTEFGSNGGPEALNVLI